MERAGPGPGRPGGPEGVRCRLDCDAPRAQPAAGRPHADHRRRLLACCRARALRPAPVVFLHALCRALRARAHRDPGGSPRTTVGRAAGARLESTPVTATTMKSRKGVIGAVLVLINLPVGLALVEAVWFYVSNRSNGSVCVSGQKGGDLLYLPQRFF